MQVVRQYICTSYGQVSIMIRIGDRKKWIRFQPMWHGGIGCVYTTVDPEEQQAIEDHPYYRKGLVRLKTVAQPQNVSTEEASRDIREYKQVKKVQQAANVLIDEYGVSECDVDNKAAIMAMAQRLGVSFPNLK